MLAERSHRHGEHESGAGELCPDHRPRIFRVHALPPRLAFSIPLSSLCTWGIHRGIQLGLPVSHSHPALEQVTGRETVQGTMTPAFLVPSRLS